MIYLIKCTETNTCKIGYTSSPENRLCQLQTGNPFALELVATISGSISDEKLLHQKFDKFRLKGEWFEYAEEIKEYFKAEDPYLMYPSMVEVLKKSSDVKLKLFASLIERNADGREFVINKSLKEVMAIECGCKPRSFDSAITSLIKDQILIKVAPAFYKINPNHVFKGTTTSQNKSVRSVTKIK
jgi:hypothetical protein